MDNSRIDDADDDMDDLDAQLPHSKLIAAATFITAAREYPNDRNGGVIAKFVTSCCSLLTTLNSFEISLLLLSAAEASSVILEYLLFLMVEHLFAAETIGLSLPAEKAAGLIMILVDDDQENASAAPR